MNILDFYFPIHGKIDDRIVEIQPYEFQNFVTHHIHGLKIFYDIPFIFWQVMLEGSGDKVFHLRIVTNNSIGPNEMILLMNAVQKYIVNFQTNPVRWNDLENYGMIKREENNGN